MNSLRINLALCGIAILAFAPAAAQAQLDDRTVADMMRECRKIADTAARRVCYDDIPLGSAQAVASPPPAEADAAPARQGFGSNQLARPAEPRVRAAAPDQVHARVAEASERERGIYLITLEDGAQWRFVESVPLSYDPPRAGSAVELISASMGSYLLRYRGQRPVRIRRVR